MLHEHLLKSDNTKIIVHFGAILDHQTRRRTHKSSILQILSIKQKLESRLEDHRLENWKVFQRIGNQRQSFVQTIVMGEEPVIRAEFLDLGWFSAVEVDAVVQAARHAAEESVVVRQAVSWVALEVDIGQERGAVLDEVLLQFFVGGHIGAWDSLHVSVDQQLVLDEILNDASRVNYHWARRSE